MITESQSPRISSKIKRCFLYININIWQSFFQELQVSKKNIKIDKYFLEKYFVVVFYKLHIIYASILSVSVQQHPHQAALTFVFLKIRIKHDCKKLVFMLTYVTLVAQLDPFQYSMMICKENVLYPNINHVIKTNRYLTRLEALCYLNWLIEKYTYT